MGQATSYCKRRVAKQNSSNSLRSFNPNQTFGTRTSFSSASASSKADVSEVNYEDDDPLKKEDEVKTTKGTPDTPSADIEGAIKLSMRLKKKILKSSSYVDQTLPMLVSLAVDDIQTAKKTPLDLICVIDHSGSMSGDKIALVRNTFKYLLHFLGDSDRLSIVIFNDRAERILPLLRTTESNKTKILSVVQTIMATGGTNINLGMRHAFEILRQRRERNPVSSIFLLSDGLDSGAALRVASSLKDADIGNDNTIYSLGFGRDHDPQLMIDIANLGHGNFHFIENLEKVDEAFIDCLGDALGSIGLNVQITVKPEQSSILKGVEIVKAHGDEKIWTQKSKTKEYTTKLATLIAGRQKDFVLELKVPINKKELKDSQKSIKVASAQVEVTGHDGRHIVKTAELNIVLLNEGEELLEEEPDREVMKNFYRVKGALEMSEARKLADQSKYDEAKKGLQDFKEEIVNCFMKNEDFIKNLITDLDTAIQNLNPYSYAYSGRGQLMGNARAQMYQCSTLGSHNNYFTCGQERFRTAYFNQKFGSN